MTKFGSIDEVLDFAIAREDEAHSFYLHFSDKVWRPELVEILRDFATEEVEHRVKLEEFRAGETAIGQEEVCNLDIADNVGEVEPYPDMDYSELLVTAMKKEQVSYKLYTKLAALAQRKKIRDIFLKLAREEAEHKLRFEFEYYLSLFGTESKEQQQR